MSVLDRLYASGGPEVIIDTLEIASEAWADSYRFCTGYDGLELTDETGRTALFTAVGISLALPKKSNTGTQSLTFSIGLVDGEAQRAIESALENGTACSLTYRVWTSNDFSTPAQAPYYMTVNGGSMEEDRLTIQAGFFDMINVAWPRDRYTTDFAPGLTYL